jgi:hypothetical protein
MFTHDEKAQHLAHKDRNKNKTEVYVIQQMLPYFRDVPYSHFLKFGGRYWFTEDFDVQDLLVNKPSFSVVQDNFYGIPIIEPVMYAFPKSHQDIYNECLAEMLNIMESNLIDVERLLFSVLQKRNVVLNDLERMNVCGYGATDGVFRSI